MIESEQDFLSDAFNATLGFQDFAILQNILRIELYCLRFPLFIAEEDLRKLNDI